MQKVAPDDPQNWDLHKFFTELYNYCFPIDYKQRTRLRLENMYQGPGQSVSEYIHELQELFNMVGDIPQRHKVIKLWYSLKSKIQKIMWKDGLHPDESTWEEVVAKAEMIEIADSVLDPRDCRYVQAGPSAPRTSGSQTNLGAPGASKNKQGLLSRSLMMSPSSHENRAGSNPQYTPNNQFRRGSGRYQASNRGRSFNDRQNQSLWPPSANTSTSASITNRGNTNYNGSKRLTEREMAELRAARKCFNCKEQGHTSRNCPNSVCSATNRPPGVPSYSMDMTLVEQLSDSDEMLESVPLGYLGILMNHVPINYEPEDWRKHFPIWQNWGLTAR